MSHTKRISLIGLSLLAAACAGSPPASLVDARAAYERASKGRAKELAPDQLHAAKTFLKTAERTYDDEGDSPNVRDRAYVAMRKAQLAEVQAQIVQANLQVAQAENRSERAEDQAHAATAEELTEARSQLQRVKGVMDVKDEQLEAETERRKQAEIAQQQALAALGNVKQDQRGTVITLSGSVIFPSGKSELLPSARSKLSEVATALSQGDANSKIVVEGHTDSVGSAEMNQELSVRRAEAVRTELIAQGVPAERITVQGFGPSRPIADNGTQPGRANNRRVEIVIQPSPRGPAQKSQKSQGAPQSTPAP